MLLAQQALSFENNLPPSLPVPPYMFPHLSVQHINFKKKFSLSLWSPSLENSSHQLICLPTPCDSVRWRKNRLVAIIQGSFLDKQESTLVTSNFIH